MPFKVFYSWQSRTSEETNLKFIRRCLQKAIQQIKKDLKDDSPEMILDRNTDGQSGAPFVPQTLEEKIRSCDVFVADTTFIIKANEEDPDGTPNSNVMLETGHALAGPGFERVIMVHNTINGGPDKLPFDIKQRRFPIQYELTTGDSEEKKAAVEKKLIGDLKYAIGLILTTELERQKKIFFPFEVWKSWEQTIQRPFKFVPSEYINEIFTELRTNLNEPKNVYRFCGLSGIGKTRMLFECFALKAKDVPEMLTNKILYADMNDESAGNVMHTVRQLLQQGENKILIVDNCPQDLHINLTSVVTNEKSKLSLITVSIDPEERVEQLDFQRVTKLLKIDNLKYKATVADIISENFKDLEQQEQDLFVEFSSGVAFVAALMRSDPQRGKHQPGSLKREDVIRRLLGGQYDDPNGKAVIEACCLFSTFGFFDEMKFQSENISLCEELCNLSFPGNLAEDLPELKKRTFERICKELHERQLLEKKGRAFAFRPTPLAISMAQEWWRTCTVTKFDRIVPIIRQAKLVESFCEQFRYLKHIDDAQRIVGELCGGVFSLAEVLNTEVGSRLFRSFVYVNPVACTNALKEAFGNMSVEDAVNIKSGRRNLVWALEKLVFRKETFDASVKILALFAVAENEGIANNARNQFLQLFHIYLPGTQASLRERLGIIDYCASKEPDYIELSLKAMDSGLTADRFMRGGGAEDQGDIVPLKDYEPNGGEIIQYWKDIIARLRNYSIESDTYRDQVTSILLENLYGLCFRGAGYLALEVIEELFNLGYIDRVELSSKVKFILRSGRVFDLKTTEDLKKLSIKVNPETFADRFVSLIKNPGSDEYFRDVDEGKGLTMEEKIIRLVEQAIKENINWEDYAQVLTTEQLAEGFNFGKSLAAKLPHEQRRQFLKLLIRHYETNSDTVLQYHTLIGVLSEANNLEDILLVYHSLLRHSYTLNGAFYVARASQLPYKELLKLIRLIEDGTLKTNQIMDFDYGWGLRHLSVSEVIEIFERIRNIDNTGKVCVFSILVKWCYKDEIWWGKFKDYIYKLLIEDTVLLLAGMRNTMDLYYWASVIEKFLVETDDVPLASRITDIIFNDLEQMEDYHRKDSHFYKVLDIVQQKYFEVLWARLIKLHHSNNISFITLYHLKDLIGTHYDYRNINVGLLFKEEQNFNTVFNWVKDTGNDEDQIWVARLLPAYSQGPGNSDSWHPYTLRYINEFGNNSKVLSEISSTMGSFSWSGSVVPKLQCDLLLFRQLQNHPIPTVRDWATGYIQNIQNRIVVEDNRDQDGFHE